MHHERVAVVVLPRVGCEDERSVDDGSAQNIVQGKNLPLRTRVPLSARCSATSREAACLGGDRVLPSERRERVETARCYARPSGERAVVPYIGRITRTDEQRHAARDERGRGSTARRAEEICAERRRRWHARHAHQRVDLRESRDDGRRLGRREAQGSYQEREQRISRRVRGAEVARLRHQLAAAHNVVSGVFARGQIRPTCHRQR